MSRSDEKKTVEKAEKPSVENRQKLIAYLQEGLEYYENTEKRHSEYQELLDKRIDFTKALLYGIFYGILGNLLVQYSLPLYEAIILSRYDTLYWLSVLLVLFSAITILIVTLTLNHELNKEKRKFDKAWTDRTASKLRKESLKELLDYLKNQ